MKKLSLLLVLLVFSMTVIMAQTIAEYTFTTSTDGTLEDMTGSSTFTNLTPGTYYDDTASTVTNIGFTFGFGLGAYTQFSVNSNGQMQLGATAISGTAASPAANTPRLAPLSGDNAIRATGRVHYLVTGTAPNRKLVVEWLDLRVPYSSATETGTYCRMQAWLYETSNNIKFVYGTMWNMSTSASTRGVYVSTSNVAGAVGNVETIIATPTWTVTGTSVVTTSFPASSAMTNLNSVADGSRRVFSINYPVYTTPPNVATLLSPSNGAFAMVGDALTWQSGGGGATSYDVYFGTTNPPAFIQNQGATSYTPTLAAGTTYYWNIVARNASGAASPTATWSFQVPGANNLVESFESTSFPPAGWANPGTWSRSTSYYKNGVASAYKYGSTSTQYILSTPKVTITGTSTFNLWTLCSSTTGTLQIVYSPDRTTWTQIGSNIAHAATYTWYNTNVDLSSLAGNNYYLGVRTGLQSASFYTDMYIGPVITPEVPGVPALVAPANGGTYVSTTPTFSWTAPTTGGVPTGYKVYCDTNNPPTTQIADVTGLTYTHTTPLANNTLYYWSVKGYNAAGTSDAPTANGFTTVGVGYIAIGSGTSTQRQPFGIYFGYERSAAIYTQAQLGQYGLLDNVGWYCATSSTNAVPYKIYAKTTTDAGFTADTWANFSATATLLKEGTYTFSSVGWHMFSLDTPFTYASGNLIIVIETFYGGSGISSYPYFYYSTGASNSHEYWYADTTPPTGNGSLNTQLPNVLLHLDALPVNPVLSVAPTSWSFGLIPTNTTLTKQFTMTNTGGGTLTINSIVPSGSYYSITSNPAPVSLTTGQTANFTIQYAPTAPGTHNGTVTINDSRSVTNISLTGTAYAPATLPFTETWEAGQGAWQIVNGTQTNKWYIGTVAPHGESNSAFISNDSGVTNAYTVGTEAVVHMYQDIAFTSGSYEFSLSFWHKTQGESTYDGLKVFLVDTSVTPVAGTQLTTGQIGNTWYNLVADWTNVVIPLSNAYAGTTKRLVFSWRNDTSLGTMPPTSLDDINLTAYLMAAPEAPVLVYPADNQTNLPKSGFNLSWTRSPTGSAPTSYIVHMGSTPETVYEEGYDWEVTTTTFNPVTSVTNPLTFAYSSVWYWTVEAVNLLGGTPYEPPRRFTIEPDPAITSLPASQNFDGVTTPAFPSGWTAYKSYSSSSINTSTSYYQSSPNSVYMYNYTTTETMRLISPQILVPISGIKLSFWLRATSTGYTLKVGTVSALDGTGVFTQVAAISPATSGVFTQYTVSFAGYSGTDQYICFQHGATSTYQSFYLDTVMFEQLLPNDMAAMSIFGPSYGLVGDPLTFTITVKNNGTNPQSVYTVYLKQLGGSRLASLPVNAALAPDATALHQIVWTPQLANMGVLELVGEVALAGDGNSTNNESASRRIGIYPPTVYIPLVGDPESTTTANTLPTNVYWKNGVTETIYTATELQMTSGTIQGLAYFNNFTDNLTGIPIKVWAKNTTSTDLSTDWLDFTGYTLVFDGTLDFPIGNNAILIQFSTPMLYTGGNFAIRVNRVMDTVYYPSSNVFYYTTPQHDNNRSRYIQSDTTTYDPTAPGTGSTLLNNIPVTAFIVSEATPVTLGQPIVTGTGSGANVTLNWAAIPGAYGYRIYASDDPDVWTDPPLAIVYTNSYTAAATGKKFFKVTAISSYRNQDGVIGTPPPITEKQVIGLWSEPQTNNKD